MAEDTADAAPDRIAAVFYTVVGGKAPEAGSGSVGEGGRFGRRRRFRRSESGSKIGLTRNRAAQFLRRKGGRPPETVTGALVN